MSRTRIRLSGAVALAMTVAIPGVLTAQRRGAPGAVVPMTDVSITLGDNTVTGRVDAKCGVDEKATPTNTRGYFVLMYPWFGHRVAPDKPQWRFDLHIRRGTTTEASQQFVFSFSDGPRSGVIQTVSGSERMGSGTVKVTRHGKGAKFEVEGRTKEGIPLRATIDCSEFQKSEAPGG
jgi:hypothetical protein